MKKTPGDVGSVPGGGRGALFTGGFVIVAQVAQVVNLITWAIFVFGGKYASARSCVCLDVVGWLGAGYILADVVFSSCSIRIAPDSGGAGARVVGRASLWDADYVRRRSGRSERRPIGRFAWYILEIAFHLGRTNSGGCMTDLGNQDRDRRLNRWVLQSAARELMPRDGVAFCLRRLGFDPETKRPFSYVRIMFSERFKRAHYKNLFICGSVWMCPICAAKISERRRVELSQALENSEFQTAMVSLTLQHSKDDHLSDLLGALLSARRRLKCGRQWQNFCGDFGIVGTISSLEVTYGVNGWHPHCHTLLVARRRLDDGAIRDRLSPTWLAGLSDRGRSASYDRGLVVSSKQKMIADYVAKFGHEPKAGRTRWTLEHELTKSVSKMSRGDQGLSPSQLLSHFAFFGDQRAGKLWQEYAGIFKGRHQLQWSRGLRRMLGLGKDESDRTIAQRNDEPAITLALVSLHQWRVVLGNDARGELVEVAHSGDLVAVQAFLDGLGCVAGA